MSQWSNPQEYRNSDSEKEECELSECLKEVRSAEPPKTVRCVIEKEFGDGLKRLGSGDCGSAAAPPPPPRRESTRIVSSSVVDSARLKNHLEWKKQKELEYLKKREAEREEELRKKEEKLREEKEKRRKEKEREEKIREWQEQKAREKEERKREEMVLKALEQEIKGVTQTIDKEKLIHEWIRLKNKQKQMEAEKKAELMKKEEETRALRQSLAEISYRQWKERTKNKRIVLPKNGYQIFGPKPVPVVKEDWNHDFTTDSKEDRGLSARTPKSTVSMTSIRGSSVSRTDLAPLCYQHDLKKKGSGQLRVTQSRTSVNDFDAVPFQELRIPDAAQRWKSVESFISRHESSRRLNAEDPMQKSLPNGFSTKKFLNVPLTDMLPMKNKLDIYIQPSESDITLGALPDKPKKVKKKEPSEVNLKKYLQGLSEVNTKLLINLNEKLSSDKIKASGSRNTVDVPVEGKKGGTASNVQSRRSRSFDKPNRKLQGNRSTSVSDGKKSEKPEIKKTKKSVVRDKNPKQEAETKTKKKPKKVSKPDPLLLVDSPYCARKTRPKNKTNRTTTKKEE